MHSDKLLVRTRVAKFSSRQDYKHEGNPPPPPFRSTEPMPQSLHFALLIDSGSTVEGRCVDAGHACANTMLLIIGTPCGRHSVM